MRYVMKQKLFTWGDQFVVKDEMGRDTFLVQGKMFTLGDQLSILDMAGNELAFIKQKLLAWGPTYEIYRAGQLYAVMHKELFTFFHNKFTVELPGNSRLEAEGDFTDHEYTFVLDGRGAAAVSKAWFSWGDTYGVEVVDGEDPVLILACTVVIEKISEREHD